MGSRGYMRFRVWCVWGLGGGVSRLGPPTSPLRKTAISLHDLGKHVCPVAAKEL